MSLSRVQALAAALSSADNEKKTTSLAGLKEELDDVDAVPDHLSLVPLLKTALESSNGHVSFAALSCIPSLVKGLSSPDEQNTLKHIITILYAPSSGSVIGFLGDSKPRVRETARAALAAATTAACQAHLQLTQPSSPSEVLQELERIAKEQGFANKVSRARVQILHYVYELRSTYPMVFQLKTYLPSMVSLLEDSDASVRSTALETIITVFQGPSISASARAGLKSELTKQAIRKPTVDVILPKVFGLQNSTSPDNPLSPTASLGPPRASSSPKSHVEERTPLASVAMSNLPSINMAPSSLMPASSVTDSGSQSSAMIQPIYITSGREMETEFSKMLPAWEGKETEHNWQAREGNVSILRGMIKSGAHLQFTTDFVAGLKVISDGLLKSLATLRTTMAVAACIFLQESAALGNAFDPLTEIFLPPLLRMAAQAKKIVFQASQAAVTALIQATSYNTRTLQFLFTCVNEKTIQARAAGISRTKQFVEVHGHRSKAQIESGGGLSIIDKTLRRALSDASPLVRQTAREVYWTCSAIWPGMTEALIETLDGPTRKQLEKASPSLLISSTSVKPASEPPKRVSVRSMINSTRTASGPAQRAPLTERRPLSTSVSRKNDTTLSAPPVNRSSLSNSQSPPHPRPLDACRPSSLSGSSPPGGQHATPPRHAPLNQYGRHSQIFPPNASVSPLRRSFPQQSPASTHVSHRTPQSSKIKASARDPSSSSDCGPQSRLFRVTKGDEENMKLTREYDLAQFNHHQPVHTDESIVEDAMKAQAEQAESAAHRLLELTEDELEIGPPVPLGPGGVLLTGSSTKESKDSIPGREGLEVRRTAGPALDLVALRQLNLAKLAKANKLEGVSVWKKTFENSPARPPPGADAQGQHLVTDMRNRVRDSWWHQQAELTMCGASAQLPREKIVLFVEEITSGKGEPKPEVYVALAQACAEHRSEGSVGAASKDAQDFWSQDRLFEKLFDGLRDRLREGAPGSVRDCELVLLRAMVLHQGLLVTGKETELCTMLLSLVQSAPSSVLIACEAIGMLWIEQTDPIYGLSCLRSAVEMLDIGSENMRSGDDMNASIRLAVTCVGEYFGRLPTEIVEEELPKARELIKHALVSRDPETRMSAVMSLVVANEVMKDEKAIMAVLGDLTRAQEALLTYYLTPEQGLLSSLEK